MTLSLFPSAPPVVDVPEEAGAIITDCGTYRYQLWRRRPGRQVVWCMLNPSTAAAAAKTDDPTIRRCRGYTQDWGYAGFTVVNLFAYRATDPLVLKAVSIRDRAYAVGPENDQHLLKAVRGADLVVCAWGDQAASNRGHRDRREHVLAMLRGAGARLHVLRIGKAGEPVHPLMQRGALTPQPWEP